MQFRLTPDNDKIKEQSKASQPFYTSRLAGVGNGNGF